MMKPLLIGSAALLLLALLALPKVLPLLSAQPVAADAGRPRAALVSGLRVAPEGFSRSLRLTGTVLPAERVDLIAEANGRVIAIGFDEGSRVSEGQLLVQLNDAELQASLNRATYRLALASEREERQRSLLATRSISQQEYDSALNELRVLQSEIQLIEAQIERLRIRAPFDGVIGLRQISPGDFLTSNTRIATLLRLDEVRLEFAVPEAEARTARIGARVPFTVTGLNRQFEATIYASEPELNPLTRTLLVRATTANPDGLLLPGGFANVIYPISGEPAAIFVPTIALQRDFSSDYVLLARDGRAVSQPVRTGFRTESRTQIIEGLATGDVVITSGLQILRSGSAVEVVVSE
jgi:membrane fusion protein, multidrug efflux system